MKIIFTIILIFFGFFTNNAFATNLVPGIPCPPPYAPGDTSCHDTPHNGGPKIDLKEIVITDDKTKYVKQVQSAQQMPISFEIYEKYKDSNKIFYYFVNNYGQLILFFSDGKYCNYTTNVCYENSFLEEYNLFNGNIFESKDFLIFVSFNSGKILIYSKEYNNFLNLYGNLLTYQKQNGDYNFGSPDVIHGISFAIKNNILDLYLKNNNSNYIGKFSFNLSKLKTEKSLFNSKRKYYIDHTLTGADLRSGDSTFNGLLFLLIKEYSLNLENKLNVSSISTELINKENTNIKFEDYLSTYSVPALNSKIFLFSDSSIFTGYKSLSFAGVNFGSRLRLLIALNVNGSIHYTDVLGGSEDKIRSEIQLIDFNYSNGYYYITYDVSNASFLYTLFTGYDDGEGKPIPGFYTIYTKDLANFSDAKILKGGYFLGYSNGVTVFAGDGVKKLFDYNPGSVWGPPNQFVYNRFTIFKDSAGDLRFGYLKENSFYISGEPILNNTRKQNINGGDGFGKDYTKNPVNSDNDLGGDKDENGDYVVDKDKVFNSQEEYDNSKKKEAEELKKKEELEKQYNIFDSYFTGFKNFFGIFLINFPENYDQNLKVPILKPLIVGGQAKIQYQTVNTQLKPIEDKLNIALVGDSPDYIKKGLSMILGLFYLSCRVGIIFLSLIFLIYFYKYLNNILNLVFSGSFSSGTSNVIGLGAFVGFFTVFFSFCLIVLGHFTILNPFFQIIIDLLNLIFGFITKNFLDFQTFYSFTNFVTVSLYGILGLYLVFRLVKTYGKLF